MKTIGIDLGGTHIKVILMDENGEIVFKAHYPTDGTKQGPGDGMAWKDTVKATVKELQLKAGGKCKVGLSAPGLANANNSAIAFMPGRLGGLENFVWSDFLGLETKVLNDAHAALIAERYFGAGKGFQNLVMLTLGTGVGGGILIDGKIYQGNIGRAGHLGHITVDGSPNQGITGLPGSLEDAIGNSTIKKRTYGRYTSTYQLLEAYQQGNAFATYVWLTSVRNLAVGLAALINVFSPDQAILGGGITKADDALFRPLAEFMEIYEWRPGGYQTPIVKAEHGEFAGAIGAAAYLHKNQG